MAAEEPVLCPIHPEFAALLKQPGGLTTKGPVRCWLDENNVLCMEEIHHECPPRNVGDDWYGA